MSKAIQCSNYGALPKAGGIDDQPAGLLKRMTVAYNYYKAHRAYVEHDINNHQQWVEANGHLLSLVEEVRQMCEREGIDAVI